MRGRMGKGELITMSRRSRRRRQIEIASGFLKAKFEAGTPVLRDALGHSDAEKVLKSTFALATSVLVEGGRWPMELLQTQSDFMQIMKNGIERDRFM